MNLPRPIYELLPVAWITGGIVTIYNTESVVSIVVGLVLANIGIGIFRVRNRYRKDRG